MEKNAQGIERRECDVLVIGGGPAGCTVAPMLAERGYRVVLLEKARHPRFHIGESLLPANLPLFERMGIAGEVKAIGMEKWAAEFVSPHHDMTQSFHFADAWDKSMPYAYQVKRAEFDTILIRNAEKKGVEVHESCKARTIDFLPDDAGAVVRAQRDDGREQEWQARFVVDASGRDTFLANRFQIKHRNPKHNSSAIYGHFAGARRHDGQAEGNITIFWFEHGWFWFIPLRDGTTSVGAVCRPAYLRTRRTDPTTFLMRTIALAPEIADRLKDAELTAPVTATGNYSYTAKRMTGPGYLLVGDAWAFIDPVFSSGVLLAMNSATLGADLVDAVLRDPAREPVLHREFERKVRMGVTAFSWLIYRMTNPVIRKLFMAPRNVLGVQSAVVSLLAGDVFRAGPVRPRLYLFRLIYYANFIAHWPTAFRAWRRRRRDIRESFDATAAAPGP